MNSLYTINLNLDKKYFYMVYDVLRMLTIQIVTQILFVSNNTNVSFFNLHFIKTTIFLCISIFIFWLIVNKLVEIKFIDDNDNDNETEIYKDKYIKKL
jgi:hypothetical protein